MKLVIACDWKTVDLLKTTDPNEFGEALRQLCFVGNCKQTGCYSTFKTIEWLKEIKSGKIIEEAKKYLYNDIKPTVFYYKINEKDCYLETNCPEIYKDGKMKICDPYEIVCAWTWDGDGCLYFRFNNKAVVNTDCKKDYTWEWVQNG